MAAPEKQIPNLITALNLFFGCIALALISQGNMAGASMLIGLSLIMDFLDGFTARSLNAYSELGKQLDSLADVVSFGVAPAFILHELILKSHPLLNNVGAPYFFPISYFPFIVAVFSAIRLARFNIDDSQSTTFRGLPTPASAMVIASLPLILHHDSFGLAALLSNTYVLMAISAVMSALLISDIRLFSLKIKSVSWTTSKPQIILAALSVVLIFSLGYTAIPIIILLYIILSLLFKGTISN